MKFLSLLSKNNRDFTLQFLIYGSALQNLINYILIDLTLKEKSECGDDFIKFYFLKLLIRCTSVNKENQNIEDFWV